MNDELAAKLIENMGRLSAQVEGLNDRLDRVDNFYKERDDKTEERLTKLEHWQLKLLGAGAFGGAVLGWLGHLAIALLSKHVP